MDEGWRHEEADTSPGPRSLGAAEPGMNLAARPWSLHCRQVREGPQGTPVSLCTTPGPEQSLFPCWELVPVAFPQLPWPHCGGSSRRQRGKEPRPEPVCGCSSYFPHVLAFPHFTDADPEV